MSYLDEAYPPSIYHSDYTSEKNEQIDEIINYVKNHSLFQTFGDVSKNHQCYEQFEHWKKPGLKISRSMNIEFKEGMKFFGEIIYENNFPTIHLSKDHDFSVEHYAQVLMLELGNYKNRRKYIVAEKLDKEGYVRRMEWYEYSLRIIIIEACEKRLFDTCIFDMSFKNFEEYYNSSNAAEHKDYYRKSYDSYKAEKQ